MGFDRELASFRHGIASIDDHVHDDLLDLPLIGFYVPQIRLAIHQQLDVFADQAGEHFTQVAENNVEIQDRRLKQLSPAESQQLARRRPARVPAFLT